MKKNPTTSAKRPSTQPKKGNSLSQAAKQQTQIGTGGLQISGQSAVSIQQTKPTTQTNSKKQQLARGSTIKKQPSMTQQQQPKPIVSSQKITNPQSLNTKGVKTGVRKYSQIGQDIQSNGSQTNGETNNKQKSQEIHKKEEVQQQQQANGSQQEVSQKENGNKEEVKQEQEQESLLKEESKKQIQLDEIQEITIKMNHYCDKFKIVNGSLEKSLIDEQYYLSGVYVGNFQMVLKSDKEKIEQKSTKTHFIELQKDQIYWLSVIEDQEAESKVERVAYEPQKKDECPLKKNKRMDDITSQLKGMSNQELMEKGDKYKELIEARDLEDCLYN